MGHQARGPIALLGALILCQYLFNSPLGQLTSWPTIINQVGASTISSPTERLDELAPLPATGPSSGGMFESTRMGSKPSPPSNNECDGQDGVKQCSGIEINTEAHSNASNSSQSQILVTKYTALAGQTPESGSQSPSGKSVVFDLNATDSSSTIRLMQDIEDDGKDDHAAKGSRALDLVHTSESNHVEKNSECALILKRTFIIKNPTSDEWGDKFVFNDVDPEVGKDRVHKSDLCIKYADVDKAIEEAKHRIKFEKPSDLDTLEISDASIGAVGELNLVTGQVLAQKFDLSFDEILNALPMIDMSSSKFFTKDLCPKHVRPMTCTKSRYRTMSAHCNNLKHPSWGASKTPYSRYLPPDYADGLTLPRAGRAGEPLPSARLISSTVHFDLDDPTNHWSNLFPSFGQLINHDMTRHALTESPDCCPQYLKGRCMPIPVPGHDPLYSKFNVKCLKFDRSLAAIRPKCLLG